MRLTHVLRQNHCVRRTLQQETDSVNKLQAAHLFKLLLQNVCRIAARVPQVLVNNRNQIIHFSLIARRIHLVLLAGSQNCACFVDAPFSLCNLPQAGSPSPHLPGSPSLERAAETAFQLPYCHMKSVLFNLSWPSAVGLSDSVSDCFFFHCLAVKAFFPPRRLGACQSDGRQEARSRRPHLRQ